MAVGRIRPADALIVCDRWRTLVKPVDATPVAILFSVAQLWTHAGLSVLAWLASFLIYRYFRLSRLYEDPPSLL